jgi:tetrahydromethanopterin S-methyltransferase subunit D
MDGIGLPILAFVFGVVLCLICGTIPPLRRFALAAFVSPAVSSVVFLFGSWILADMNPCAEYGSSCIPNGGHDPTRLDVSLWLLSVAVAFVLSTVVCFKIQQRLSPR